MAEPSANLRVRISADLADIRQGLGVLTRQLREVRSEAGRPLPVKNQISDLGISAGQTAPCWCSRVDRSRTASVAWSRH